MKIAIYSGEIPSTTFIENLIAGLATRHELFLFGMKRRKFAYANKNITVAVLPQSVVAIFCQSVYWMVASFVKSPSDCMKLHRHIVQIPGEAKGRFRLWCKYGPIVFFKPELFHIQWAKRADEWIFLKELFGIRLVVSFRGSHMNYSHVVNSTLDALYAKYLPLYDGYHAVSNDILANAMVYGINREKARVVFPAVVDSLPLPTVSPKNRKGQRVKLLSVGRNDWVKGYDTAIDACALLVRRGIDFEYDIIGTANSEELIFQVEQLGLTEQVKLLGAMPQAKVMEYYRNADFLVLPSHAEGIANVVLEAMAMGLPVVSTRCGGIVEVIEHGVNGWLVPIRDPEKMADQLELVFNMDVSERCRVANAALDTVRRNHLLSGQVAKMEELYKLSLMQ